MSATDCQLLDMGYVDKKQNVTNKLVVFVTWRPDHGNNTFIDRADHLKRKGFNTTATTLQTFTFFLIPGIKRCSMTFKVLHN